MKRSLTTTVVLIAAAASAAILAACGDASHRRGSRPARKRQPAQIGNLGLYSSLPMNSAHGQAITNGMMLVSGGVRRVGRYTVTYHALSDAAGRPGWSQARTLQTASSAATDPHVAFYVGDLNPDANAVSVPILNQARVAQLSPAGAGAQTSPTSNFVDLQTASFTHAAAAATSLQQSGCNRVVITSPSDRSTITALRDRLADDLRGHGVTVVANRALPQFLTSLAVRRGQDQAAQRSIHDRAASRSSERQAITRTALAQERNAQLSYEQAVGSLTSGQDRTPVLQRYSFGARRRFSIVFYALARSRSTHAKRRSSGSVSRTRLVLYHPVRLAFDVTTALPATHLGVIRK